MSRRLPKGATRSERLWDRVIGGSVTECWRWTGAIDGKGYGFMNIALPDGGRRLARVHRLAYEEMIAPIPEGLVLDHLCRTRECVNPWHLEPVTHRVNILRGAAPSAIHAKKTHCPKGHPYDERNTRVSVAGSRVCRACRRVQERERWARLRNAS